MNTETLVKASSEDVLAAYRHFREVFYPKRLSSELLGGHFWQFVGVLSLDDVEGRDGYWSMPEKAAHYVNLLKGPHYKAIANSDGSQWSPVQRAPEMTQHSEISRSDYYDAMGKYWELVNTLPKKMQRLFPIFEDFVSPANYISFNQKDIELSITGTQRYQLLQSPHARALLAAWAAQRLEVNSE